jgi:hypothetical protein
LLAIAAPSRSTRSLAHAIWGWTRPPRPQSVPAMTFSPPDDFSEGDDAVGHQFGVPDDISGVADDSRDENFSGGQFHIAPDFVFMFVADVASFDQVRLDVDPEHDIKSNHRSKHEQTPGRTKATS